MLQIISRVLKKKLSKFEERVSRRLFKGNDLVVWTYRRGGDPKCVGYRGELSLIVAGDLVCGGLSSGGTSILSPDRRVPQAVVDMDEDAEQSHRGANLLRSAAWLAKPLFRELLLFCACGRIVHENQLTETIIIRKF